MNLHVIHPESNWWAYYTLFRKVLQVKNKKMQNSFPEERGIWIISNSRRTACGLFGQYYQRRLPWEATPAGETKRGGIPEERNPGFPLREVFLRPSCTRRDRDTLIRWGRKTLRGENAFFEQKVQEKHNWLSLWFSLFVKCVNWLYLLQAV